MDFKILTTLKELSQQKNLGRKARNVKNQMEILKLRETTVIKTIGLFLKFYWSIVALKFCVNFYCTAK